MAERNPPTVLNGSCYEASDFRLEMQDLICEGGVSFRPGTSYGELAVSPSVTGMTVDVAAGGAFVLSSYDEVGAYHVWNDASVAVTMDTADPALPRIDTIVARVVDPEFEAGSDGEWFIDHLTGTPTGGANLTNLNGKWDFVTNPVTCVILAYVLVDAAQTGVFIAADISDQRKSFQTCGKMELDRSYIRVSRTAAFNTANAPAGATFIYDTVAAGSSANFNTTTGIYTCPDDGIYVVRGSLAATSIAAANHCGMTILYNGAAAAQTPFYYATAAAQTIGSECSTVFYASRGDTIGFNINANAIMALLTTIRSVAAIYRVG